MFVLRANRLGVLTVVALVCLVALSVVASRLDPLRPDTEALWSDERILVTSAADAGVGSLREALFTAGRSTGRPTVLCHVDRILLETPLPPLVSPRGVVLTAPESAICEIDARNAGAETVLNVAAPNSVIARLRVRSAQGAAIAVRARRVSLTDVEVVDSSVGVVALEGARELLIAGGSFSGNGVGVRVDPGSGDVRVRGSHFFQNEEAGVWAVAPERDYVASGGSDSGTRLHVRESTFERDRIGVVAMHTPSRIENSVFAGSRQYALYLAGSDVVVRGNRIREGAAYGVVADATDGALIENNEVDRNGAVGAMLRYASSSLLRNNRIYSNPYGVVVVLGEAGLPDRLVDNFIFDQSADGLFVLGSSPILRDNEIAENGAAGIRVLDYSSRRAGLVAARPHLENNVLRGNARDTIHSVYRQQEPGEDSHQDSSQEHRARVGRRAGEEP